MKDAFRRKSVAVEKVGGVRLKVGGEKTRRVESIKFQFATDATRNGDDSARAFEKARKERSNRRFETEIEVNGDRLRFGKFRKAFKVAKN